jgi:hypothetical protein
MKPDAPQDLLVKTANLVSVRAGQCRATNNLGFVVIGLPELITSSSLDCIPVSLSRTMLPFFDRLAYVNSLPFVGARKEVASLGASDSTAKPRVYGHPWLCRRRSAAGLSHMQERRH